MISSVLAIATDDLSYFVPISTTSDDMQCDFRPGIITLGVSTYL